MKPSAKALALVCGTLAAQIAPPERIAPSAWAAKNLIVPDGPRAGEAWDPSETPYILEPLDLLGPDTGVNEIAVMKGVQTGFTTLLIAAIGHSIDRDPCRMAILQPTDGALSDFNRDKLQPAIDGSKALAKRVASQQSRSATGSTTYNKKYPGGSLDLMLASSASDLRSKTLKKLFRDEIDEYPDDLDGQGDPLELSDGRLTSFLSSGEWKKADISTPTIKGASKIERRYEGGDKRRWRVPCPHCGDEFTFEWGPSFGFERTHPHKAHYVAPCCGSIIQPHEKRSLVRKGRWVATDPGAGRYPSYHFDTLSSPFVPWDHIAAKFVAAGDDPLKLKAFYNLWLGQPYEFKGDAPDHKRLMERREEGLARGRIPPRGLMLVASADVQMRGIWVEVLAIAPNRESWPVEVLYLDGSTESPEGEAFAQLKQRVLDRDFPDAFGRVRKIDALGVDSGYRSHVVYAWTRLNQRLHPETGQEMVLALDGRDGWGKPPIGTPSLVDIDLAGHKVKKGAKIWPVGTWSLKGGFYADLRKPGAISGADKDPEGYCHFGVWLDETYFKQLTAEYLAEEKYKGRPRKVWKIRSSEKDNHLLDCRVYNLALAEYLGLSTTSEAEWAQLARRRGMPEESIGLDLFAARTPADGQPAPLTDSAAPRGEPAPPSDAAQSGAEGGADSPSSRQAVALGQSALQETDEDPFERLARLNAQN